MAQVLPALDPPRYARLFGPATHILFAPHHEWSADCVVARNVTAGMNVTPARGTLHWDRKIRNAIRDRRIAVFETRVAAYLKDVAPERVQAMEPSAFAALLSRAMTTATALGIITEAGYCRWAYLMLITGGQVATSQEVLIISAKSATRRTGTSNKIPREDRFGWGGWSRSRLNRKNKPLKYKN